MKKLLSLLSVISITASGSIQVIACKQQDTTDKTKVNNIVSKIETKSITNLKYNTQTDASKRKTDLDAALKNLNPTLSGDDLASISYIGKLEATKQKTIIAVIKINNEEGDINLKVTMNQNPDVIVVNAIKAKITTTSFTLPYNTQTDASKRKTDLDTALKTENSTLTDDDLAKISYIGTLIVNTTVLIIAVIKVDSITDNVNLTVTMNQNPDVIAVNAIIAKITNKNITIPLKTNINTSNTNTINTLKSYLQKANTTLSNSDLTKISFANITLDNTKMVAKNLLTTITSGSASKDITLSITINNWVTNKTLPTSVISYVPPVKIGDTYYLATFNKGLWTSTDGSTWTKNTTTGLDTANMGSAPVKIGDTYYLATFGQGLWTSTDGSTWTKNTTTGLEESRSYSAIVKIGDTYYLATFNKGLWTSTDGSTWTKNTTTGLDTANMGSAPVKIGDTYYLATFGQGLWTSTDGSTWTKNTTTGLEESRSYSAIVKIGDTYYLITVEQGLWTSTNGSTWTKNATTGLDTANMRSAPVLIEGTYYLSTANNGLWTSTNGTAWREDTVSGFTQIHSAPVLIEGTYYLTTVGQGLWTSANGETWIKSPSKSLEDIDFYTPVVKIDNTYFLSTYDVGLLSMQNI